jgi:non-specific serine/threonine protein kinase
VSFDTAAMRLRAGGAEVEIENRPLRLLQLLLEHAGEVVTKDELLDALWPDRIVTEASLTKCVNRLRAALHDTDHSIIRTVHGYGYRLDAAVTVQELAGPRDTAPTLSPGQTVPGRPDWTLVRLLGSGGFGEAWLAAHATSAGQRVLKFAAGAAGLGALRREVSLCRLLHGALGPREDIVGVLDWNFAKPPPFIELPFYALGSLAAWCAARGGADRIPLEIRLDLAAQVADAVAAAHGVGVLHKDIKPGNILMRAAPDGSPAVALADFGSGRALEPARLDALGITRIETELGDASSFTSLYRAPELLAGGVPTVQADIYALGVLLYQLVAGNLSLPLAPGWERRIDDTLLREDIAAAAAGDPAARLSDAADLATRLRSLRQRRADRARLDAEAAEAASLRRALELARARRAPLRALFAVLVMALAATTALYVQADRAQSRAESEATRARTVTAFLTDDVFSAANPALGADPNIPVRKVLDLATADLDRRFPPGSPDRAAIEAAIGSAYAALADADHAQPLLRSALASLRASHGDADPQAQAVRLALAALAEHRLDDDGMREAGQELLASHPRDAETLLAARFYVIVGGCGANGNAASCADALRPVFEDSVKRLGPLHPFSLKVESELAHRLGDAQMVAQAVPMARETVARTLQAYGPDHLLLQERRFDLASVLVQAARYDEAIAILADVRARLLAMMGIETDMSARAINQIGIAYQRMGRYEDSLRAYRTAQAYSLRSGGESSELSLAVANNIASCLSRSGHPDEAIPIAEKVFRLYGERFGADSTVVLWAEDNLAADNRRAGHLAAAETIGRDVVARARRVYTHGEYYLGYFATELGETLAAAHKSAEARALLTESVTRLTQSLGAADPHTQHARALLSQLDNSVLALTPARADAAGK